MPILLKYQLSIATKQSESLSIKVIKLSTQTSVLEKQISDILNFWSKLNTISLQFPFIAKWFESENSGVVQNIATNLVDELITCKIRKFNLVIHNLPETTEGGSEADKIF